MAKWIKSNHSTPASAPSYTTGSSTSGVLCFGRYGLINNLIHTICHGGWMDIIGYRLRGSNVTEMPGEVSDRGGCFVHRHSFSSSVKMPLGSTRTIYPLSAWIKDLYIQIGPQSTVKSSTLMERPNVCTDWFLLKIQTGSPPR